LEYDLSLIPTMETMGIKEVFSPSKASLGRLMKGLPGAYIKAMMQAATFDLFEKGVTAAAATAAVAGTRGGGGGRTIDPTKMKVDRPHLMFIVENKLDVLLFAVVVNNPKVKVIN
jgi:serpin B